MKTEFIKLYEKLSGLSEDSVNYKELEDDNYLQLKAETKKADQACKAAYKEYTSIINQFKSEKDYIKSYFQKNHPELIQQYEEYTKELLSLNNKLSAVKRDIHDLYSYSADEGDPQGTVGGSRLKAELGIKYRQREELIKKEIEDLNEKFKDLAATYKELQQDFINAKNEYSSTNFEYRKKVFGDEAEQKYAAYSNAGKVYSKALKAQNLKRAELINQTCHAGESDTTLLQDMTEDAIKDRIEAYGEKKYLENSSDYDYCIDGNIEFDIGVYSDIDSNHNYIYAYEVVIGESRHNRDTFDGEVDSDTPINEFTSKVCNKILKYMSENEDELYDHNTDHDYY